MLWLAVFMVCALAALVVGVMSARSDIKGMVIPNAYSLAVIGLFFPAYIATCVVDAYMFSSVTVHAVCVAITFLVTFGMFAVGMIGGGDAKLISAYSFWFGGPVLVSFLFFMALAGSVLAAFTLVLKKKRLFKAPAEGSWIAKAQDGEGVIPYAVAILVGVVGGFVSMGALSPEVWESFLN